MTGIEATSAEWVELQLDGMVGPSHHFAGLGLGNLASQAHRHQISFPRAAALEGLAKVRRVMELGIPQALLPPQHRPRLDWLRQVGFEGDDAEVIAQAGAGEGDWLSSAYSASSMWAANAASVSPASDTRDGRLHVTAANLISGRHRSLESFETTWHLRRFFAGTTTVVHEPLPALLALRDEGGANHTRLTPEWSLPGIEFWVHGESDLNSGSAPRPQRFLPRQTKAACEAIVRRHRLDPSMSFVVAQSAEAIDAGVFHNDVISVGHRDFLMFHEQAFADGRETVERISQRFQERFERPLRCIEFSEAELPMRDAVASYLFNSQWLTGEAGDWHLICPRQCERIASARRALERLKGCVPELRVVHFVDLDQSMSNGGGPACLRLRIAMSREELMRTLPTAHMTPERLAELEQLVRESYRERLSIDELRDPAFASECLAARQRVLQVLGYTEFSVL